MRLPARLLQWSCLLLACALPPLAVAQKQTVCTITINSPDEQKSFRRYLPEAKYEFVELVERGRKDWLASACQAKVSCDVLLISGHYGEGNEFFSDVMEVRESLPIEELERVSCSDSCPSLFANLKEVHLYGCDTLNPRPQKTTSGEIVRAFQREGHTPADAVRLARQLTQERGESSRDRMRLVFRDVPVIYGFSSKAPLGPEAATSLNRFFQASGTSQIGTGRPSGGLLRQFSAQGMVAARGMTDGDAQSAMRRDVCNFANDKLTDAQRLGHVHHLLQRPAAQSRMLLGRIEKFTAGMDDGTRQQPEVAQLLQRIGGDDASRDRYLAFARDADEPQTRARMIEVASDLGWLSGPQRREEIAQMFSQLLARKASAGTDVDLACKLNRKGELDGLLDTLAPTAQAGDVGHAAILACMGNGEARSRVLQSLASPADAEVQIAQTYLRHQPIQDAEELRKVSTAIAAMGESQAQARALDTLARHYLSDRQIVDTLERLYAQTRSWPVQNAIAGVLIRADPKAIDQTDLLRTLREYRLKSSQGDNMVDALIQRLQLS